MCIMMSNLIFNSIVVYDSCLREAYLEERGQMLLRGSMRGPIDLFFFCCEGQNNRLRVRGQNPPQYDIRYISIFVILSYSGLL